MEHAPGDDALFNRFGPRARLLVRLEGHRRHGALAVTVLTFRLQNRATSLAKVKGLSPSSAPKQAPASIRRAPGTHALAFTIRGLLYLSNPVSPVSSLVALIIVSRLAGRTGLLGGTIRQSTSKGRLQIDLNTVR